MILAQKPDGGAMAVPSVENVGRPPAGDPGISPPLLDSGFTITTEPSAPGGANTPPGADGGEPDEGGEYTAPGAAGGEPADGGVNTLGGDDGMVVQD